MGQPTEEETMDREQAADALASAMSNALTLDRAVKEYAQKFQLDPGQLMAEVKRQIAQRVAARIADDFVGRK
jgi:hypothetical protein